MSFIRTLTPQYLVDKFRYRTNALVNDRRHLTHHQLRCITMLNFELARQPNGQFIAVYP